MTNIVIPSSHHTSTAALNNTHRLRTRRPTPYSTRGGGVGTAFLAMFSFVLALTWPIFVYILSPSYSPNTGNAAADQKIKLMKEYAHKLNEKAKEETSKIRSQMTKLLQAELHDIVGYGSQLPRVAVVVVGSRPEAVAQSVESVFRYTDRNRILTVVAVLDGVARDTKIERKFMDIDEGKTKHFHGLLSHAHLLKEGKDHSKKLHTVFQKSKLGIAASRRIGVDFINLLVKEHMAHGLKDEAEDIILLLLRSDATLTDKSWLEPVTAALIIPPTQSQEEDRAPSKKAANAVSLATDHIDTNGKVLKSKDGSVVSFGLDLQFEWTSLHEGNLDFMDSYPTPAALGPATALRLNVFNNLPARDSELKSQFGADMELSLNIWLCGDGIDVIPAARVLVDPSMIPNGEFLLSDDEIVRIAMAWMDGIYQEQIFKASSNKMSLLEAANKVKDSETLPEKLANKCRTFKWYAAEVNPNLLLPADENNTIRDADARSHDSTDKAPASKDAVHSLLTKEQMDIIKSAKMQSIAYEDYSNGHKDHPHRGALDESDEPGYVHDAIALHKNPPQYQPPNKSDACREDDHYKMLTQKVVVDFEGDKAANLSGKPRAKLFCVVYTTEKNHDRIPTLRETWGQKCDGFMVASTKTDRTLGTVNILHQGDESYENIWQKIRSVWSYVYDNYYIDFDWFHIGGDDLYLIVENLRLYLESDVIRSAANGGKEPLSDFDTPFQTPLFLGRRFAEQGNMERIFNSGGSGYTINRAALKLLIRIFPQCYPNYKTFAEDVMVAECFRNKGVFPFDTRDEFGGERYMPFTPGDHFRYRIPPPEDKDWYPEYSVGELKVGLAHCSKYSVAFHYALPNLMNRMHAILYGYC